MFEVWHGCDMGVIWADGAEWLVSSAIRTWHVVGSMRRRVCSGCGSLRDTELARKAVAPGQPHHETAASRLCVGVCNCNCKYKMFKEQNSLRTAFLHPGALEARVAAGADWLVV